MAAVGDRRVCSGQTPDAGALVETILTTPAVSATPVAGQIGVDGQSPQTIRTDKASAAFGEFLARVEYKDSGAQIRSRGPRIGDAKGSIRSPSSIGVGKIIYLQSVGRWSLSPRGHGAKS